ncbi:MAG: hypothetical protein QOE61_5712 [Micromonosporaceae bacterium]|nr:hypothetical protein [Micromonosporaceae bacterium]
MLVFATSDKGGTGRSVTSANVVYRRALQGSDVAYLDFDFGSPTAGTVFNIDSVARGTAMGGLHAYLRGEVPEPQRLDVWSESERQSLRGRPDGAGQLVLFPGDLGGGEFAATPDVLRRCVKLLLRMEEEFDITLVDLSAGRSYATDVVLAATALPELMDIKARWLVFHRWTRQHIIAAEGLVAGVGGIIELGVQRGHNRRRLSDSIRYVRTAVVDPNSDQLAGLRAEQVAWLRDTNQALQRLAGDRRIGRTTLIGSVPLDPVLQWREQLITDWDTTIRQIANRDTVDAFELIAKRLDDDSAWAGL